MPAERFRLSGFLFGLLCAVMFGFAAGAVWMVPSMMFGRALPALVLPVGWLLGIVTRRWLRFDGLVGALVAALSTLLACYYTACLFAAVSIAGMMGIGFSQAISDAGPAMLSDLARLAQTGGTLLLYLAGAVLGALVAWPVGRRPRRDP